MKPLTDEELQTIPLEVIIELDKHRSRLLFPYCLIGTKQTEVFAQWIDKNRFWNCTLDEHGVLTDIWIPNYHLLH